MNTFRDILDPSLRGDRQRAYTSYILHVLGAGSLIALAALFGSVKVWKAVKKLPAYEAVERRKLAQALRRLERRRFVRRERRDDGNEFLLLTEAGERAFFKEQGRTLVVQKPNTWDGHWRIVIFDIAESKKTVRDALRRHLHNLRFYPLQKSVFVTPYPCEEEIRFLQKFYESQTELYLILALSLDKKEREVRKHFGLT